MSCCLLKFPIVWSTVNVFCPIVTTGQASKQPCEFPSLVDATTSSSSWSSFGFDFFPFATQQQIKLDQQVERPTDL